MADVAEPVISFDNFPHPLGVVPSHETLAALIYYAKEVSEKAAKRPQNPATMMVVDANRLAKYVDELIVDLQKKYDEAKFDYDMFCGLSPYELFDKDFYEIFVTPENNILDFQTKRYHYIENIDDDYPDCINSDNGLNLSKDIIKFKFLILVSKILTQTTIHPDK